MSRWNVRFDERVLAVLLTTSLAGCGMFVEDPTPPRVAEVAARRPREKYVISPHDELEIRFFHTPDLNVTLPVRPDGYIALPHAREVRAAGRTPDQLAEELTRRYSVELLDPEIAVVVRSFSTQKVHVGGRVETPGVLPLSGPTTLLQALFEAGGTTPGALLSQVLVIRRAVGGYSVIAADVRSALNGEDLSQNITLLPLDVVYVPDTPIVRVNEFVDTYVRQNIPVNFGLRAGTGF